MRTTVKYSALFGAVLFAGVFSATPASAQATRTWVSGVGDDANPCSRTAPCKTFGGAISKTAAGGEIDCLDPAGFGAVTITKSLTIDCTGTLGGILASSTTGVIVNGANAVVLLRGLSINGGPPTLPGVNGVRFIQGSSLTIEDSIIFNFLGAAPNGFGVNFQPTGSARLVITNTTITNNGTASSGGGIQINPSGASGAARVTLDNVRLVNNPFQGLAVNTTGAPSGVAVSLNHSTISNSVTGISSVTPAGTGATLVVTDTSVFNNSSFGISANGAGSTFFVSGSRITVNGTGLQTLAGGSIRSYGDNILDANGALSTFTAPVLPKS